MRDLYRLRSFVRRGRVTASQTQAHDKLWPQFGLSIEQGFLNFKHCFGREAACFLEIGFGSGQSILTLAEMHPDKNFIAVETHRSGIGSLLRGMEESNVSNIRIYNADVIDVLENCMPDSSLAGVQVFFPDPWPKRRHKVRRLIQPEFIQLVMSKLSLQGYLHLATDWEDYAYHMLNVVTQESQLSNLAGKNQFAERSLNRPVLTKFEIRALQEGRQIWEIQCVKV